MAFVHAHCLAQWAAASGKKDKVREPWAMRVKRMILHHWTINTEKNLQCDTCMTFYATSGKHYKPLVEWKAPLRNGAAYVLVRGLHDKFA